MEDHSTIWLWPVFSGLAIVFGGEETQPTEGWADFGDDLRVLADRAYPDLQEDTRERLSLNRYLDQLTDPQIAFGVRQTFPGTVDKAVTCYPEDGILQDQNPPRPLSTPSMKQSSPPPSLVR